VTHCLFIPREESRLAGIAPSRFKFALSSVDGRAPEGAFRLGTVDLNHNIGTTPDDAQTDAHATLQPDKSRGGAAVIANARAGSSKTGDKREDAYAPYAVDWRFLPEEVLIVKDTIRHHLVNTSNYAAAHPVYSNFWKLTLGAGPLNSVLAARRLFIHIPKTGGTSICKVLYSKNLPHYTARFWSEVYGKAIDGIPSFSVLRHPAERLVSAYKMIRAGGTDMMAYSYYWRRRMSRVESFEGLLDHISEHMSRPGGLSADLAPQSDFILDRNGRVTVDRLFCFDRRGLPDTLTRWLGVPALPHINATPPAKLSIDDLLMKRIRRLYEQDFEIYDSLAREGCHGDMRGVHFS